MTVKLALVDLEQEGLETQRADARLASRVALGDADALGELYDRYGAACFRVAHRITANHALAEEVVQESFLAVWRSDRYREGAGTIRTWLFALVHHKAVDAVRRESSLSRRQSTYAGREPVVATASTNPEPAMLDAIRDEEVRAALSDLSAEQRQAIVLAYFGGHTQREIAEMTGLPLGTVKTRMFSGMRRLRHGLAAIAELQKEESDE